MEEVVRDKSPGTQPYGSAQQTAQAAEEALVVWQSEGAKRLIKMAEWRPGMAGNDFDPPPLVMSHPSVTGLHGHRISPNAFSTLISSPNMLPPSAP